MHIKLIRFVRAGCLLMIGAAVAQDPTVVEPSHYKLAFENDEVQVVDVHYGPHEKSTMHSHPGGVVVYITEGHLKFTDAHGSVKEVIAKPGEAGFFPPFQHKVENLDRLTRFTLD
jgi:beta-alanine degradation protein BauB